MDGVWMLSFSESTNALNKGRSALSKNSVPMLSGEALSFG
uniref:Uncharacterized protein n=1 Tax=Anguilla anguilla TaxID=7936 RepID=A0A0E9SJV1_ANGAN